MSVSSVNSNPPVLPPQHAAAPPAPQVNNSDHDGDSDAGVRAATPRGVGGLVDKDA